MPSCLHGGVVLSLNHFAGSGVNYVLLQFGMFRLLSI